MNCPITVRLGVYALGAGDEAERILIENHLVTCPACREELALLEPLPGLLDCVPVELIRTDSPPAGRIGRVPVARITRAGKTRAGKVRTSAWRLRSAASLAAAAALGAGGFWLAQPGASPHAASSPPAAITLSGANPATHVRVTMTLAATSWGTSIQILAWGLPLNQQCELIVRSRTGGTEVAGAWDAWSTGPVNIPGSAAWRPQDIASLEVATSSENLVTVSAVRPQAKLPPSSPLGR